MARSDKNLRRGYTTGSCATAATKAALLALIHGQAIDRVAIALPQGERATFCVHRLLWSDAVGEASVIKDAGDDPDVTHQAEICSRITWAERPGITFKGGRGVGRVTRQGLPVPPGEPAINPVPRQMMEQAVHEVLAAARIERGVTIEISVPEGERLAKKTFNPRLGIIGGISILGTTGIVVPYSTSAWRASVLQGIDVAVAQDCKHIAMTVGARGEKLAKRWVALPPLGYVQIGPFFGEALEHAAAAGVLRISLVSMIGKLAKFAAGHSSVHSGRSEQDFTFLSGLAADAGAPDELKQEILHANTAQQVAELMREAEVDAFFQGVCDRACTFAQTFLNGQCELEVLLLAADGSLLARAAAAPRS